MDENAITMPDGTPLRSVWWDRQGQWIEGSEDITTERAASRKAIEITLALSQYSERYQEAIPRAIMARMALGWEATLERCLAALAYKRGTTVEVERAVIGKKVATKIRKMR